MYGPAKHPPRTVGPTGRATLSAFLWAAGFLAQAALPAGAQVAPAVGGGIIPIGS